jgi:hypothetical protein
VNDFAKILDVFFNARSAVEDKPTFTWPDTAPPRPGEGNTNINGRQYKKAEWSPGKWRYVIDQEAEKYTQERDKARRELFWALRSRVLTLAEMDQVKMYGKFLNVEEGVPYMQAEKDAELNAALLQQFNLRLAAEKAEKELAASAPGSQK